MLRWDRPVPEEPEREWVKNQQGDWVRRRAPPPAPPQPKDWEAHRRVRHFDERSGRLIRECHDAVRVRFQNRGSPYLPRARAAEPPVPLTILLASCLHGAVWFGLMAMLAFGPSPWWALVPALAVSLILGVKFALVHALVLWVIGSMFIAFDGYWAFLMLLPVAALFAPGKWIGGEW
jgi:hypothetical protein